MREDATEKIAKKEKEVVIPTGYGVPGPQEPLPGRSHNGNYFPLFPFHSAYVGGVELDPSISRHIGGDINIPVPSWGMIDFNGDFNNRIRNTVLKTGVSADPVNNLGLRQKDFNRMMGSPSFLHNRQNQPTIPLVKLPREFVPKSCKAPLCNPYQQSVGYGLEYDWGGNDGVNGGFDFNMPVSKEVGFRVPVSGNIYYALENITITYAQNLGALDPKTYLLKDDMENDPFNFPDIYSNDLSPTFLKSR
uniref:DM13 domain-containing protein n=1 Tax=Rhabditophanes sp. KR3021 TaxID=114890 RepID=A0AC35TGF2_9BILA